MSVPKQRELYAFCYFIYWQEVDLRVLKVNKVEIKVLFQKMELDESLRFRYYQTHSIRLSLFLRIGMMFIFVSLFQSLWKTLRLPKTRRFGNIVQNIRFSIVFKLFILDIIDIT